MYDSETDPLVVALRTYMESAHVERAANSPALDPFDKTLLSTRSAYAETSWEAVLRQRVRSEPSTFVAKVLDAQQLALDSQRSGPLDALFKDVRFVDGRLLADEEDVTPPDDDTAALAYVLSKYMRHAQFSARTDADVLRVRSAVTYYLLLLAARCVTWKELMPGDDAQDEAVFKALQDTALLAMRQGGVDGSLLQNADAATRAAEGQVARIDEQRNGLRKASWGASRMHAALRDASAEMWGTAFLVVVANACFLLLTVRRPGLLAKYSVHSQAAVALGICAIAVYAIVRRVGSQESMSLDIPAEFQMEFSSEATSRVLSDGLRAQAKDSMARTADASRQADVVTRRKEHVQQSYAAFRFGERRARRLSGLLQFCLALTLLTIGLWQSGRVSTLPGLAQLYGAWAILAVTILCFMYRIDKTRFRSDWHKIYFPAPK
jgi:hypothetical protein